MLALRADSLYVVASAAVNFIDSLRNALLPADTSEESIAVTARVIGSSNIVEQLYHHLMNVYSYSINGLVTKSRKSGIDSLFYDIKSTPTAFAFLQKWFRNTPSVGAATILAKFKNDCVDVSLITLKDIRGHLAER